MERITRNIQYFGVLKLPVDKNRIKFFEVTFDLVRSPYTEYRNDKANEPTYFYGYLQLVRNSRILKKIPIEFRNQVFVFDFNEHLAQHQELSCATSEIIESINCLATKLNVIIQHSNPIKNWKVKPILFDEVWVKLVDPYTIGRFDLNYSYQEVCMSGGNNPPQFPEDLPEALIVPAPYSTPDENFAIAPPYTLPNDGGRTYMPQPIIPPPAFPSGEECQIYTYKIILRRASGAIIERTLGLYGVIGGFISVNDPFFSSGSQFQSVNVNCQGLAGTFCQAPRNFPEVFTFEVGNDLIVDLVSQEIIP
jgi:hypothetical protein